MPQDYPKPIVPPPELVQQWDIEGRHQDYCTVASHIAARAAQWGADQELEDCVGWLEHRIGGIYPDVLRANRRPKPPSLKEQALEALEHILHNSSTELGAETIRRALEALDD
jgi:hypothetical protein